MSAVRTEAPVGALPESPFPGLNPFSEQDVQFFFGRTAETRVVAANLVSSRVTVLYGPSGVGKSSLLRAGVAPVLRARAEKALERGEPAPLVVVFPPDPDAETGRLAHSWSEDPMPALIATIRSSYEERHAGRGVPPLPECDSLLELLDNWPREAGDLLLVLDQFEEYLLYAERGGGGTLADELADAVTTPRLRLRVLFSLREDAYTKLLDHFEGEIDFGNFLHVEHLDRDAAQEAIEGPVDHYNALAADGSRTELGEGLVDAVLDDLASLSPGHTNGGPPEEPQIQAPFLQLVMEQLWREERRAGSRELRVDTLRNTLGGARKVWRTHLDEALSTLERSEQDLAARIFNHLVTPSRAKIALDLSSLVAYGEQPAEKLTPVLEKLSEGRARIIRPLPALPDAGDEPRYEIFHDVLAEGILSWRARHVDKQKERQRRKRRRYTIAGTLVVLVTLAFAALATIAIRQSQEASAERNDAEKQEALARSGELALRAVGELPDPQLGDPQLGVLLALEALKDKENRSQEAATALRRAYAAVLGFQPEASVTRIIASDDGPLTGAAFSPDGRLVVTATDDGTLRVWRAGRREPPKVFDGHVGAVNSAVFGPDETRLASAGSDGTARVWSTENGDELTVVRHEGEVSSAEIDSGGELLLTAGEDGVRLWDVNTGDPIRKLGEVGARSASFSGYGTWIVTAHADGRARVWETRTGKRLAVLKGQSRALNAAAFGADDELVVTVGDDGTARVWDWEYEEGRFNHALAVLRGQGAPMNDAAFSPDGTKVITAGDDGTARVWRAKSGTEVARLRGHEGAVVAAAYSADGSRIVTASADGTSRIWAAEPAKGIELDGHDDNLFSAGFNPDGTRVATASIDGTVRLWNRNGELLESLPASANESEYATATAFAADGRIFTASGNGTLRIWSATGEEMEREFEVHESVWSIAVSRDGGRLVTTGEGIAVIHDLTTDERIRLEGHKGAVYSAAFNREETEVVTAGADKTIRVWEAESGEPVKVFRDEGDVFTAAFSPDGRFLLTAGEQGARIWEAETGKLSRELGDDAASSAAFSPDGLYIVTGDLDGKVRLWSASSGELLVDLPAHEEAVWTSAFVPRAEAGSAGGRTFAVLTASDDDTGRIYECDVCLPIDQLVGLAEERMEDVGRPFTRKELVDFRLRGPDGG